MRRLIGWFLVAMFYLGAAGGVWAGTFNMKSIGGVDTDGKQISHWWVTVGQPTLRGEAVPGEAVTVTIDGTALQVNADSAGDWVFTPLAALADGEHSVALNSGGSNINFTLTTGRDNVDWAAVERGTGEALPTVGVVEPTVIMAILGIALAGFGARIGCAGTRK